MLQRLVAFDRERFHGERGVGIAEAGGVGGQRISGLIQFAEAGIDFARERDEHFDVVGSFVGFGVMNEERLDSFLSRLLSVISGDVVERRFGVHGPAGGFQITPRFDHPGFRFGWWDFSHKVSAPG